MVSLAAGVGFFSFFVEFFAVDAYPEVDFRVGWYVRVFLMFGEVVERFIVVAEWVAAIVVVADEDCFLSRKLSHQ